MRGLNFGFLCREPAKGTGRCVAVVGAGPSGLAAAGCLSAMGHAVDVYDKLPKAGGLMAFGIPGDRLPRHRLEAGIRDLENRLKVRFHPCTRVVGSSPPGKDAGDDFAYSLRSLSELMKGHDAVLICTGAWRDKVLGIPGQNLPGVVAGLDFLVAHRTADYVSLDLERPAVTGRRVVVLGGGHTALDAAHCAMDHGAEKVTVAYRRTRSEAPCGRHEVDALEGRGGRWMELSAPRRILGRDRDRDRGKEPGMVRGVEMLRCGLGPPDETGRACPLPRDGTEEVIEADLVIFAVGLEPTPLFFKRLGLDPPSPTTSCWLERTAMDGVYVAGDALNGPGNIGRAVYSGLRAARVLDAGLSSMPTVSLAALAENGATTAPPGETGRRLFMDYSLCIGCETCEAVCRAVHFQPRIRMDRTFEGLVMPLYCRHCERPKCAEACPVGAISMDEAGAVLLDRDKCSTCRAMQCVPACPFAAMFLTGEHLNPVTKCDLCADRQESGLLPACEQMCPTGAIRFVTRDQEQRLKTEASGAALKTAMSHIRRLREKSRSGT